MDLSRERRRFIAVKDGMYLTKNGKFTSNLWEAAAVRRIDVKEKNVQFITANELFEEIKATIKHHERIRDTHADIVNKLEFLKLVS